jgi:Fur family ferric uptake transcriptional regulator
MKSSQEGIILKQYGIQPTPNREEVLSIFLIKDGPLDTQYILEELAKKKVSIDRATVFRTINSFVVSFLLNKLEFNEGKSRYELTTKNHHHHLICTNCGSVTCFEECNLTPIEQKITNETGFIPQHHRVEFFGLCKMCASHVK